MSLSRYSRPMDANLCRAVIDSVVDVVIMVHDMANEARVIYANEAACQHFGVDLETLLTWTPAHWDPYHNPDLAISMALADGQPRCYETEHLVALGDKVPVEVTLNRLNLPGCNYLLSSIRELRTRQLREPCADWLERRALEMCLERSDKSIYDNLLDSLFLFDVDVDGELIVAGYNRRAEGLIGLREAESIGRRKQDVLPSATLMGSESPERACVADAVPVCFRDTLALPDGRRQVENTLIPLFDAQDRVQRVIYIVHDITQRLRRESQEVVRTEVFDLLSAGVDLHEVLARVVMFAEISRPDLLSAILLPDAERTCLESCIAPSLPEVFLQAAEGSTISESADVFGRSAYLKMPETVANLLDHDLGSACHVLALASGLVTCWVIPILDSSDELLGIFAFFRDRAGQPDAQDQATMDQACQMARLVMERRRTEAHIRYQANYDSLTGLPNRTLLNVRLAGMLCQSKQLALLYIDIDNFKEINDTLGHHQGDQMLELVARRLHLLVSKDDLVARMSGDEFIAVLSNVTHAESTAEALRMALAGDYEIGHSNVWASVSIGIALYPEQARDMDELLSNADQALFAAKAAGRNCLRIFDEAMREKIQLRVRLASDLRTALKAEQLSVHYQPIIDLFSGQVIKAEALLRWEHPELGQVSPEVFIPIAEETGAIHEIGNWVFREAARVAMQWNHQELTEDSVLRRISVNRSPRQFFTREGCDDWLAHLHDQGIPGEVLGVEITEGLLLDDRPDVMRQLTAFRSAGIAILLDDFGTGYSALSYLKKFDIDYLKIDRSFVQDIVSTEGSRAIVESIASMAVRLGMQVIAEGVEEPAQAEVLTAIGCRLAQGYLYARPMPEQAFMAFAAAEIETPTLR